MVIIGVDPHQDQHTAVALDGNGQLLGQRRVANQLTGFAELSAWAQQFSDTHWAIEGT